MNTENTITKLEREVKDLENQIQFAKAKAHTAIMQFKVQVQANDTPEYYMGNDFYKLHTDMQSACRWVEVLEGNLEVKKELKKDILEEMEKRKYRPTIDILEEIEKKRVKQKEADAE